MKHLSQIKRVLIALEDNRHAENVASYGYEIARKLDAVVTLLTVYEIPVATPYVADPLLNESPVMVPEIMSVQEDTANALLNRLKDQFGEGLTTLTIAKLGNPKEEILATADEWNADLIVAGTHGRTGFDYFISGSVAEKVMRKAKCPVFIIPTKDEDK